MILVAVITLVLHTSSPHSLLCGCFLQRVFAVSSFSSAQSRPVLLPLSLAPSQDRPFTQQTAFAVHFVYRLGGNSNVIKGFHDNTFATRAEYRNWLLSDDGAKRYGAAGHTSSPFVWISAGSDVSVIGGCDDLEAFASTLSDKHRGSGTPSPAPPLPAYSSLDQNVQRAHANFWKRLVMPGTYFTGAERVQVVQVARAARACPQGRAMAKVSDSTLHNRTQLPCIRACMCQSVGGRALSILTYFLRFHTRTDVYFHRQSRSTQLCSAVPSVPPGKAAMCLGWAAALLLHTPKGMPSPPRRRACFRMQLLMPFTDV